ncbi:hypothetical protein [Hydrogenophaga sp. 5NK40-0174]|uniref:hypothetical protein n=1 Tax=Hydrogenophaga sp. 5NK40-0174 TaxID=3127649 RepID=UPI00310A2710
MGQPSTPLLSVLGSGLTALALCFSPVPAKAQGFAAYVSPPRFEFAVEPGQRSRQVIEIQHVGQQKGNYRIYTADWTLGPDYSVNFSNELAADSCRPWVAIERKQLTLNPEDKYRYRFEVAPPADAPARECRFAIMIEGIDTTQVQQGAISFPVSGRIGVIVYARIGGAAPVLELVSASALPGKDAAGVALAVRNTGNAHGRLIGFVNGSDAQGQSMELAPADLPILPGETRTIPLQAVASEEGKRAPRIEFPIQIRGALEWGDGQTLPLEATVAP